MKYFKDANEQLHAFEEDGSQDYLIKDDMVEVPRRPSPHHKWVDGAWYESPEGALDRAKAKANQRINDGYQAELNAILRDYPDAETKTWDKQESEARAYQDDSSATTPLIDAIASARNMGKAELVQRVIAKADAWISLSGAATGKRQALEDAIAGAETVEAADAINW